MTCKSGSTALLFIHIFTLQGISKASEDEILTKASKIHYIIKNAFMINFVPLKISLQIIRFKKDLM